MQISSTENVPQVLDYYRNFLPDLLVKTGDSEFSIYRNNMGTNDAFRQCLEDNSTCFTEERRSVQNCNLENAFYQVDLDGDCVSEIYAFCSSDESSNSHLLNLETEAEIDLGKCETPVVYDFSQSGALDLFCVEDGQGTAFFST